MRLDTAALALTGATLALLAPATLLAEEAPLTEDAVITELLESLPEDVRTFNTHLTTLASPFMEGRLPGTRGMETAKQYCEYWLDEYGLEKPFPVVTPSGDGEVVEPNATYRQPFPLSGTTTVVGQSLQMQGASFTEEDDFVASGLGGAGEVDGGLVFCGYGINEGENGYTSFPEDLDLSGRIAVMLRFEPMDENGKSKWAIDGPWSNRAAFNRKLRAVRERGAAAVIMINTPGADDPRVNSLGESGGGGRGAPVLMMSPDAGDRLSRAAFGTPLMDLRRAADEGTTIVESDTATAQLAVEVQRDQLMAENVAGMLPGRGALKNEIVVVGAHLDHLGMGEFGSRSGPGTLHTGADDNASGSAGVLLIAEAMKKMYDELPDDADARSVLFMLFSAEESGLNGSRYYANNPISAIEDHVLMINFDMIGRILNDRLSVSGAGTGEGLKEWLEPYFADSGLDIVQPERMSGASDHTSFYRKDMPVLFGIIADFHGDYHTPADLEYKINRIGAVKTSRLFTKITYGLATRAERFAFVEPADSGRGNRRGNQERQRTRLADIKVRFGITPGVTDEDEEGILVRRVDEDSSASEAGLLPDDRIVKWDKEKVETMMGWMRKLADHEPGDVVQVVVMREGQEKILYATLKAK